MLRVLIKLFYHFTVDKRSLLITLKKMKQIPEDSVRSLKRRIGNITMQSIATWNRAIFVH